MPVWSSIFLIVQGTIDCEPSPIALFDDISERFFDVFVSQIFDEDNRFAEKIVNTFVFHAPINVVRRRQRERKFSSIIECDMHIDVVILWIDFREFG